MLDNNLPHQGRDLCGYGKYPPDPKWPNDARVALNFVINIEEGAEHCILNGDAGSENYLVEITHRKQQAYQRDYLSESIFEYGSRCGVWRLLNLFEALGLNVTLWACGQSLERQPDLCHYLAKTAHEVGGHGYRWIDYRHIPPETEREHIRRTIEIIESFSDRPVGWYTGRRSAETRNLLVEAGIRYDSESYNDDLPYWTQIGNQAHLIIPYTFDVNDAKYNLSPGWMSGEDFLNYLKNTFLCLYREGKHSAKMMTVALHARISGRPGRAEIIYRFLEFIQQYPETWVATRKEIAQHWYTTHPPT